MSKKPSYKGQLDAMKPLESCEYKTLNREIGVAVSEPFFHAGMAMDCVEIIRETPTVNTQTFGNNGVPVKYWQPKACEFMEQTIADIDKIVRELIGHRNRLVSELYSLRSLKGAQLRHMELKLKGAK